MNNKGDFEFVNKKNKIIKMNLDHEQECFHNYSNKTNDTSQCKTELTLES